MSRFERPIQGIQAILNHSGAPLTAAAIPLTYAILPSLPEVADRRALWARPVDGEWWLGLGCAWQSERRGDAHLAESSADAESFFQRLAVRGCEGTGVRPRLAVWSEGGFTRLHLPVVQFIGGEGGAWLIVVPDPADPTGWRCLLERGLAGLMATPVALPGPPALSRCRCEPEAALWLDTAEQAIAAIRAGHMAKLVLARKVRYSSDRPFSLRALVRALAFRHPQGTFFAVDLGDDTWLGASPEMLLERRGECLISEAVAGTRRRDPQEGLDRELGEWLLRDAKSRHEHGLVVAGLTEGLRPFCESLALADRPKLLKLRGLQHLHTPIEGRLRGGDHALKIAHALHPSPAVCGYPRPPAAEWLAQYEPLERGGYSGLTGWVDAQGDAALNLVLRCARLRGESAELFAGAGLVADSDPLAEWEETELKLGGMIEALQDA